MLLAVRRIRWPRHAGDPLRLIVSTILSLFYVPIVFTYDDDAKRWLSSMSAVRKFEGRSRLLTTAQR